jgi:hypothetical protein
MPETPTLSSVYLTLPTASEPELNLRLGEHFVKFKVTLDQIYGLNQDIADALIRNRQRRLPDGQIALSLTDNHPTEH